jgi:hypothetical protein
MRAKVLVCIALLVLPALGRTLAQRSDAFGASRDHPAIAYSTAPLSNVVTRLDEQLRSGATALTFNPDTGYLPSLLAALKIPVESQVLVVSPTSFQAKRISRSNPRALYFNDQVAVGYVRGGDILELAVQDPKQGAIFYTLPQSAEAPPAIVRDDKCLSCHLSWDTRAVPGLFVQTVFPRKSDEEYANGFVVDHRVPLVERWGGWFVTGTRVPASMGNQELIQPEMTTRPASATAQESLDGTFERRGYLSMFSDVVALMLLDHQVHAVNLITRAGWEHRVGSPHVRAAVDELVDYLLFVDEAPLPHAIKGSSGFAETFASLGPTDRHGRSLRQLDLSTRLMRYPLSYMIYSPGFAGLPDEVKAMTRARLDQILTGQVTGKKYAHLTASTRRDILDILAATYPAS